MTLRLLFLLLICGSVSGQSTFQKVIGDSNPNLSFEFVDVNKCDDGFIIGGLNFGSPILLKIDSLFQPQWGWSTSGSFLRNFNPRKVNSSDYKFTSYHNNSFSDQCFSAVKIDSSGIIQHLKTFVFPSSASCFSALPFHLQLNNNHTIIAFTYFISSIPPYEYKIVLMRTDNNDSILWSKAVTRYVQTGFYIRSLSMAADSTFYISGNEYLGHFDINGNLLNQYFINGIEKTMPVDNGILVYGRQLSKISQAGATLWSYDLDSIILDDIFIRDNRNILCVGSPPTMNSNLVMLEFDSSGNYLHGVRHTLNQIPWFKKFVKWSDDPLLFYNVRHSNGYNVIAKIDSLLLSGCPFEAPLNLTLTSANILSPANLNVTYSSFPLYQVNNNISTFNRNFSIVDQCATVSVEEEPEKNSLSVYPNPSDGNITISMPSYTYGPVTVTICSIDGREVYHEARNQFGISETIKLDLPSGFYYLRVFAEGMISTSGISINK